MARQRRMMLQLMGVSLVAMLLAPAWGVPIENRSATALQAKVANSELLEVHRATALPAKLDNSELLEAHREHGALSTAADTAAADFTHFSAALAASTASPSPVLEDNDPKASFFKLSVGGKCFLSLAVLSFLIQMLLYVVHEMQLRLKEGRTNQFLQLFSKKKLDNAKTTLLYVPVLSILMLFVVFRAHVQVVAIPWFVQWGMTIAAVGIYLQALETIQITIVSDVLGNLSQQIGLFFLYTGYATIVYAAFFVKDPDIPLSPAAKTILALTGLSFVIVAAIKYFQYAPVEWDSDDEDDLQSSSGGTSTMVSGGMSPRKAARLALQQMTNDTMLANASVTCEFVPMAALMCFYLHFRLVRLRAEYPQACVMSMVFVTVGIYMQAFSELIVTAWSKPAALGLSCLGLLLTYGGFIMLCAYAIMFQPWSSMPVGVACSLMLLVAVGVMKLFEVIVDWILSIFVATAELKDGLDQMLAVTQHAEMLCILMMYIHFRCVLMLGLTSFPSSLEVACRAATYSMFIEMSCILMVALLPRKHLAKKISIITALCSLVLLVSFATIVYHALTIGPREYDPETDYIDPSSVNATRLTNFALAKFVVKGQGRHV